MILPAARGEMPGEMADSPQASETGPPELTSAPAPSADALQWHESLETGWKEAKATGRPMLIFITTEECVYCDAMKRGTLCDESIRKRLFASFVPIRLRPSVNNRVLSRIEISAYPTTLVAHPYGKVATHRIGYQPVDRFHAMLSEVDPAGVSLSVR